MLLGRSRPFSPMCRNSCLAAFSSISAGALIYEWLIQSARRLSPIEYISLLAIALLILQIGFIAGVFIGVIIGCATFAVSASRVNAIKFSFDGSEYRSTLDREPSELAILADAWPRDPRHEPAKLSVLRLGQPALSAGEVSCLRTGRTTRFLLFDFRLVTGIDSSAIHSFTQIKRAADELGARLVLVNLSPELQHEVPQSELISRTCVIAEDLDRALEACEKEVILAHSREGCDRAKLARMVHASARQCRLRRAAHRLLSAARSAPG